MKKELNAHIGEIKIAKRGETLKCILGSCVGIGILWRQQKICGLSHCFLPSSPEKILQIGGRYVDQAIPSLLTLMRIHPEHYKELEVVVVGGGNMTQPNVKTSAGLVGTANFDMAIAEFAKLGMTPKIQDRAEVEGRKLIIDSESFAVQILSIPRISAA
jgi:chemotaxis protein CheD